MQWLANWWSWLFVGPSYNATGNPVWPPQP